MFSVVCYNGSLDFLSVLSLNTFTLLLCLSLYYDNLYLVIPELQKTAFSVVCENGSLDCVAPDEETFNYWLDGINTLLG